MTTRYQHTQIGWVSIGASALAGAIVVATCAWQSQWTTLLVASSLLGLALSQTCRMTVTVEDGKVIVTSGTGHLRKVVDLVEVDECEPVRNRWWYGWGLRLIPNGWLINVSGLDAVELRYRGGGVLRIGTDQPWQLCDAIQLQLEHRT
jgi:hypothetical protein